MRQNPKFIALRLIFAIATMSTCALSESPVIPNTWAGSLFTNPKDYQQGPYAFIISALPSEDVLRIASDLNLGKTLPVIPASLVTLRKPQTQESVGFILSFTADQVIGTSGQRTHFDWHDVAGWNSKDPRWQSAIEEYSKKYPIRPPWHIEDETPSTNYNEIALRGLSSHGNLVRITGAFVWVDKNGKKLPSTLSDLTRFEKFVKAHDLPLVKFYSPYALFPDQNLHLLRDTQTHALAGFTLQRFSKRFEVDLTDPQSDTDFAFSQSIFQNRLARVPLTVTDHSEIFLQEIQKALHRHPSLAQEMALLKSQFDRDGRCSAICDWLYTQVMPSTRGLAHAH